MTPDFPEERKTRPGRRWMIRALPLAVLGLIMAYGGCTGPRDLALYPPAATSPYRLPWAKGVTRLCVQGNRAVVSHRGRDEFAYDFAMPVGSDVCAARGGVVAMVEQSHDGRGTDMPNNFVCIQHDDGTLGWYLHIRQGGALVRAGQTVLQGQRMALSGNVGRSLLPHLHFHVTDDGRNYLRVTFSDVETDRGIPRMFRRYTPKGGR